MAERKDVPMAPPAAYGALVRRQQFLAVRVAVMPPLVTGELPGITPSTQATSLVERPRPEAMALFAAFNRFRKTEEAESEDCEGGFLVSVGGVRRLSKATEKSATFLSP